MTVSFGQRAVVPENVLLRELDGESILLNLETGTYFSLNGVGTHMWGLMTSSDSLQEAYDILVQEYDVAPEQLQSDMETLVVELVDNQLLGLNDG